MTMNTSRPTLHEPSPVPHTFGHQLNPDNEPVSRGPLLTPFYRAKTEAWGAPSRLILTPASGAVGPHQISA